MDERIYIIISRLLCKEATEEDQRELQQWLAEDQKNSVVLEEMTDAWQQADALLATPAFDTDAAWSKVAGKMAATPASGQKKTISFIPSWAKLSVGAAAALLLGFFVYQQLGNRTMQVVADAQNTEVLLPDNTHVFLRKGASISYPRHFAANERHVELKGEAFFEVTRNEKQPFTIDAQAVTVSVLGTSFDVDCGNEDAVVTVKTGKVQMTSNKDAERSVILTPGEQGKIKKDQLTKANVSSDNYLYWKTGIINFRDQPFRDVVKELGDMHHTSIAFDASVTAELQGKSVQNVSFQSSQSLDEMLSDLCIMTHCVSAKTGEGYIIRAQ